VRTFFDEAAEHAQGFQNRSYFRRKELAADFVAREPGTFRNFDGGAVVERAEGGR
jgi:hypothetical protein